MNIGLGRAFIDAGHALSGFCHLWRSARATWVPPGLAALCVLPTQHASQISKAPLTNQHHPFKLCAGHRGRCVFTFFAGDRCFAGIVASHAPARPVAPGHRPCVSLSVRQRKTVWP